MIPQIGFAEMIVLALLAIIVVGPKDLPVLMRRIGGAMAKVRAMGQEFKDAFADMEAETEMAELRKEIQALKDLGKIIDDDLSTEMREIDMTLRDDIDMSNPKADDA
ncbi:MAG: Sec-independent protein translocase protein TatB [Maricaulaceae bacterium]